MPYSHRASYIDAYPVAYLYSLYGRLWDPPWGGSDGSIFPLLPHKMTHPTPPQRGVPPPWGGHFGQNYTLRPHKMTKKTPPQGGGTPPRGGPPQDFGAPSQFSIGNSHLNWQILGGTPGNRQNRPKSDDFMR